MAASSFKNLRNSTGMSQPAFADLLDVSVGTVQAIEQGRVSVSENVARRAFVETGAIPANLTAPESPDAEPLAWTRERYAPRHFGEWQRLAHGDLLGGTGHLFDLLPAFYDAALTSGKLGKFQAFLALALHDAASDLGIHDAARELAATYGVSPAFEASARLAGRIQ